MRREARGAREHPQQQAAWPTIRRDALRRRRQLHVLARVRPDNMRTPNEVLERACARRRALHQVDKKLSVDFFSNLPFWDLSALNSSTTDYLISMDTYVPGNATFEACD